MDGTRINEFLSARQFVGLFLDDVSLPAVPRHANL